MIADPVVEQTAAHHHDMAEAERAAESRAVAVSAAIWELAAPLMRAKPGLLARLETPDGNLRVALEEALTEQLCAILTAAPHLFEFGVGHDHEREALENGVAAIVERVVQP